ncbi:MAG TPA: hypothetical protein VKA85_07285, partial [Candidatus Limnocylindrales bacterium]|nr:hypothetical protein [Candidatus Limnocylindrales bacterium]
TKDDRDALISLLANVAPGNAIAFLETTDGSRRPAALDAVAKAVAALGGAARERKAPKQGELASWIERQATERGVTLAAGAAREIARRVGGFVREGDIDRRRQGQLAVGELEKLALYRPAAIVSVDDVGALVPEVVPGSTWAFLDAVAGRRVGLALELLERLFDTTPDLVVMAQLHRRVRDLVQVADHLASGASPGSLVRTLGLKPFRAEKLAEQARAWTQPELDAALDGLVELDAAIRGAPGAAATEAQRRLAFVLWIADRVGRAA